MWPFRSRPREEELRIILLGLDAAGKDTARDLPLFSVCATGIRQLAHAIHPRCRQDVHPVWP